MTLREQILQTICALLMNHTPAASRVFRSRVWALDRAELPAIVVKPGAEDIGQGEDISGVISPRNLEVRVELFGRGDPADQLLDPVIQSVNAAVMADRTLGGLAQWVTAQGVSEPEFDGTDDGSCMIVLSYTVVFSVLSNDLSIAA